MDTFLNLTEIYNDIHNKNCKIVCICSCTVSVYGKPRMCYIEFVYDKIKKQYKIQYANNIICAFHSHKYHMLSAIKQAPKYYADKTTININDDKTCIYIRDIDNQDELLLKKYHGGIYDVIKYYITHNYTIPELEDMLCGE